MFTGLLVAPFKTQFLRNRSPADALNSAFLSDDKVNEIIETKFSSHCTNLGKVQLGELVADTRRESTALGLINSLYEYLNENSLRQNSNKGFSRVSGINGGDEDALIIFSRLKTPNDDFDKTQIVGDEKYVEQFLIIFYKPDGAQNQLETNIHYVCFYSHDNWRFALKNLTQALIQLPGWCGFDYAIKLNKWEDLFDHDRPFIY